MSADSTLTPAQLRILRTLAAVPTYTTKNPEWNMGTLKRLEARGFLKRGVLTTQIGWIGGWREPIASTPVLKITGAGKRAYRKHNGAAP